MSAPVLLEAHDLTVRFGGHVAVSAVSLQAHAGEVTGLIGPNGAGKTTTFNALCGLQATTRGEVFLDGADITALAPHQRARRGLGRTFQRLETFTLLTVRENILAGAEFAGKRRPRDRSPDEITDDLVRRLGLEDVADVRIDGLPTGRARLVEVARALANQPTILLLDEPSSGLNEAETQELASVLADLAADGLAVLMVEHDMSLVMKACQHIFVLDFGQVIASGTPEQIQNDPQVLAAYLGQDRNRTPKTPTVTAPLAAFEPGAAPPLLEVQDLSAGYGDFDVIEGVNLTVEEGNVFALLGPNGAGKTTVLRTIAGLITPTRGSIALAGRNVAGADADALARLGLCTVPEGRGVFPNLTVAENLWMASSTGTPRAEVEAKAYEQFPRLGERRTQVAGTMSGGEQQMLAMARALTTDPALLLLDELSMGLAPLVVQELYQHVHQLAADGLSILVVEQFAHEVLGVADVAAVMLHGAIRRVGSPTDIAEDLESAYLSGSLG